MHLTANGRAESDWREVSKGEPCPVCEKPDWCSVIGQHGNPEAAVCMRVESSNRRGNGGFLHKLRESDNPPDYRPPNTSLKKSKPIPTIYGTAEEAIASYSFLGKAKGVWSYHDANGNLVGKCVRLEKPGEDKSFRPVAKVDGGWSTVGMPEPRPLYRLPELLAAEQAFICEGEKACDALCSVGLIATTSAHGSKSPAKTDWSPLAGKDCIVFPDNDKDGETYAATVGTILSGLEPPPRIRVLSVPTLIDGSAMPKKGDAYEWVNAHGDAAEPETIVENLMKIVDAAESWQPPSQEKPTELQNEPSELTDMGNAERFAAQHGGSVKYNFSWKRWYVWSGSVWQENTDGDLQRRAKKTARGIYREAADFEDAKDQKKVADWAKQSQSLVRIKAMLEMAQSEQPIPIDPDTFDAEPWLLNCDNGTIDLQSGLLREHRAGDMLSQSTNITYPTGDVAAPLWEKFLGEIFLGDQEMVGFMQRLCGLMLVGEVFEHILPFSYGTGSNGKGVFWDAFCNSLGDYGMRAPNGLLMKKKFDSHPAELADLYRKRLVVEGETDDGAQLNESRIKMLTGGDSVRARWMKENFFEFKPTHTLSLIGNHRPKVKGRDNGIWRRLRLIGFDAEIPDERQDLKLPNKLQKEYPAILQWAVRGCLDWQRRGGLDEPRAVRVATDNYKAEQDVVGSFIDERCMLDKTYKVKSGQLYSAYHDWCEQAGETPQNSREFRREMETSRGFNYVKNNCVWVHGITTLNN